MRKSVTKKILLVISVLIMAFGLASCGSEEGKASPYVGTWTATTCEYSGMELDCESIFGGDFIITVEDGGKYTIDLVGEGDTGKWEESENGIMLDGELEFTIDGNTGTLEYQGVMMFFERM